MGEGRVDGGEVIPRENSPAELGLVLTLEHTEGNRELGLPAISDIPRKEMVTPNLNYLFALKSSETTHGFTLKENHSLMVLFQFIALLRENQ